MLMGAANAESGPWTVGRLLAWTREYLQRHDLDSPRLCAELLLCHAMGCERIHLYTQHEAIPNAEVLGNFRAAVRAAAAGRPIAHLTGIKEFFSLAFEITPDVLIPRPETELLVERAIDLVRHSAGQIRTILDLGTGSGCIAVALARNLSDVALYASDVSESALAVARRNAERHGVQERISFVQGDLFEAWAANTDTPELKFDLIVSNPPYVATAPDTPVADDVRQYEPHVALFAGPEGLDVVRRIVARAPEHLAAGGHLLMEIAFDQSAALRELLHAAHWRDMATYPDPAGHERVVYARSRAGDRVALT
ncbi:MAG: peptide chain release factor N(5)-glutamine methyltransferase [Planctomycetota bacterium]